MRPKICRKKTRGANRADAVARAISLHFRGEDLFRSNRRRRTHCGSAPERDPIRGTKTPVIAIPCSLLTPIHCPKSGTRKEAVTENRRRSPCSCLLPIAYRPRVKFGQVSSNIFPNFEAACMHAHDPGEKLAVETEQSTHVPNVFHVPMYMGVPL